MPKSLIEQWFPAQVIGAESMRERGASSALPPINFLHVWWARRPLTTSRGAVIASLLPAWPTDQDLSEDPEAARVLSGLKTEFSTEEEYRAWFLRTLGILGDPIVGRRRIKEAKDKGVKLEGNGYGYARAFTVTPDDATVARVGRLAGLRAHVSDPPVILDPFAGGGSIPFEAARFGCSTIANELNPVAGAILHATVQLPATLGPTFEPVLRYWGEKWAEGVRKNLEGFFPLESDEDSVIGYIWAHTVPCPSTSRQTPLAPDFWLARGKAGRDVAIDLKIDNETGAVQFGVVEGESAKEIGDRSTYKQGTGTSIWTGETFSGEYIRQQALAGHMGAMLIAVAVSRPGKKGRYFRPPSSSDLEAVSEAERALNERFASLEVSGLVPNQPLDDASNYDRGHRYYGIFNFTDFFRPRQLLALTTALQGLKDLSEELHSETPDRAKAVMLYLALALDKAIDYNSRQCSWDATRLKIRNTFDKHNFAFKWSFAEFDGAHSLIPWALDQVLDAYRGIAKLAYREEGVGHARRGSSASIELGSATKIPLPDNSVDAIVTDPPYYDNVMYAECSDYFYVWLKRALSDTWPELCEVELTEKDQEAVANPSLFQDIATHTGRGRRAHGGRTAAELADAHYEQLLTQSFVEANRVLRDDGMLTVMFTHKRVDAWDTLGSALLRAGFSIESSWPVHTESEHSLHQAKKNAASSTILLTCRKRASSDSAYWTDLQAEVKSAAREAALRFAEDGLAGIDLTLATFGPVLSVLSRRWPVYTGDLDESGEPQLVRPDKALDLAREEVARLKKRGLLGGRDVEFDRVTDWYLLAWSDFAAAEFPSGEALKLSIATHLELDDLAKTHRVIKAASGTVTLLTPAQRRAAGALDLEGASFPTILDALHVLMLIYDEDGRKAAESWLGRTGMSSDQKFRALIEAALRAIPRTKEKGEFVRPEAKLLESIRSSMFDDIPAPPELVDPEFGAAVLPDVGTTFIKGSQSR